MDWLIRCKKGATLIELLVALFIVSVISGVSVSAYNTYREHNSLKISTLTTVEVLRYAQSNAQAVKDDAQWSVVVDKDILILKNGEKENGFSFASGVTAEPTTIAFDKVTGFTSGGVITIRFREKEKKIIINEKGNIQY